MDTQHWTSRGIWWKLGLLTIAPPIINTAIATRLGSAETASNMVTASETETTSLSIPEQISIIETPPQQRSLRASAPLSLPVILQQSSEENSSVTSEEDIEDILDFSDTGRAGQQTAGEGRGQCAIAEFPLTALVPTSNWGKTIKEHPTFWFYVPSYSEPVSEIEFIFQDQDRNHLWKKQLSMGETSGYLNVSLPQDQPGLETGKWYRWYLKVYCDAEKSYPPKVVYGWVTKVMIDSSLQSQLQNDQQQQHKVYGKAGIWFDAIDSLFQWQDISTTSPHFQNDWQQLITATGVDLNLPQPKCSDLAKR